MDQAIVNVDIEAAEISRDMRALYDRALDRGVQREEADTLANIAGKNLKALSLMLAYRMVENESLGVIKKAERLVGQKKLKRVK